MSRPSALSVPLQPPEEGYLQPQHSVKRQPPAAQLSAKYQVDSGFADLGSNGSSVSGGLHENEAFAMSPVRDQQHLSASASDIGRARPGKVAGGGGGGTSAAALHDSYQFDGDALTPIDNHLLDGDQCTSEFSRSPTGYQNSSWTRTTQDGGGRLKAADPALSDRTTPSGGAVPGSSRENMRLPPRPESMSGGHEYEELPGGGYQPPRPNAYMSRQDAGQRAVAGRAAQIGNDHPQGMVRAVSTDSGRKKSNPLYALRLSEVTVGRRDSDDASSSVAELARENHDEEHVEKRRPKSRMQQRRWSIVVGLLSFVAVVAIVAAVLAVLLAVGIIGRGTGTSPSASAVVSPSEATPRSSQSPSDSIEQRLASLQEQVMQLKNLTSIQAELLLRSTNQINELEAQLHADSAALRGNYSSLGATVARLDSDVAQCAGDLTIAVSFLRDLVANVSKMPGPPGPPGPQGFNGSQGAPGAANLSQCAYFEKIGSGNSGLFPDTSTTRSSNVYWNMTVVSVTCSAVDTQASYWRLNFTQSVDAIAQYRCDCTFPSTIGKCALYAWACPNRR